MSKYVFPAIFEEEGGLYNVLFPDLEGCYTCGDDIPDAIEMAEDILSMTLAKMEMDGIPIPKPSKLFGNDQNVVLILANTLEYKKRMSKKSVKKTLTIPEWLNVESEAQGINFSQVLQESLMQKLGLL